METDTEAPAETAMDLPECPVCLQSYDGSTTVPRVLPCGHTACEPCLARLPARPALPDTIRCPACNQLVRLPSPLGPKSLPKNIDLLRFSSPSPNRKPEPKPEPDPKFLPLPWTESLLSAWKHWILPQDFIDQISIGKKDEIIAAASVDQTLVLGDRPISNGRKNQRVSLFPIGTSSVASRWFHLSYFARVMESVCQLEERVRTQLGFLLEAFDRQRRGICRVFGLWMNPDEEGSPLFLVCEKFERSLSDVFSEEGKRRFGMETVEKFGFGMVGIELCEVVMGFHLKGVVFGCLAPDCFCFDEYGHCLLDLNNVLVQAKRIQEEIKVASISRRGDDSNSVKSQEFLSPEVFVSLHEGSVTLNYGSDVWSLGCILVMILVGDAKLAVELFEGFYCLLSIGNYENFAEEFLGQYEAWREKVFSKLEASLLGTKFDSLLQILSPCLSYHLESRPQVRDIWCCFRSLFIEIPADGIASLDVLVANESKEDLVSCLILGDLFSIPKEADGVSPPQGNGSVSEDISDVGLAGSSGSNMDHLRQGQVDGDVVKDLQGDDFKYVMLEGHHDCITGLAVGGGYLFSSSFDKTVNVWSLQDFSHVQSLRGHEHRVMAMIVVDQTEPLCISGDSGSGIFVWRVGTSFGQVLLKKWYEHNDWRYSGVHSLAISGEYLYSGSGDKSIKAWALQDYSLACTMTGHKSTVSSLAVADGILYSGSWDGTIRLWCLNDHSLLSILGDDSVGISPPILSLSIDRHLLVSSYENGYIKIWRNDAFVRSMQIQDGAIFALRMDTKWLFTGGWNKLVNIHEFSENELQMDIRPIASITCDSVITSLLYWRGKLFVGFSNKEIKVYHHGN